MSYLYHATYRPLLKKIRMHGLDSTKGKKTWPDSVAGVVYLADDKDIAESYAESSDMVPESYLDDIIVFRIDCDRLDQSKLFHDSNVRDEEVHTFEYHGIIPFEWLELV